MEEKEEEIFLNYPIPLVLLFRKISLWLDVYLFRIMEGEGLKRTEDINSFD